jgi:hypothetical protein
MLNMRANPYTPKKGSIAALVLDYFRRNPTETITADDMYVKFGLSRATNIRMELIDAYTIDMVNRREVGGEYEYSAGKRLLAELNQPTKPARKNANGKVKILRLTATPAGPMDYPDPLTVPIDDDVPCTSNRAAAPVCWLPLLARLVKPLQSAELPIRCRATLGKSITQAHKVSDAKYRTKQDKSAATVRVWRVA